MNKKKLFSFLVIIHLGLCYNVTAQTGIGTITPAVKLHIKSNGATFRLEGSNHVYLELYPQGPTNRFGFFGYPSISSTSLTMMNESSSGSLVLGTNSLSRLTIDNSGNTSLTGNLSGNNASTSTLAGFAANINTQTSTSYDLVASDNGKIITLENASPITLRVPVLFAGFNCMIIQLGVGQVTLTQNGTIIVNRSNFTKTGGKNAIVTIIGISNSSFISSGDMSN